MSHILLARKPNTTNYDIRQSPSTQLESLPLDMCLINSADIINRLSGPLHRQFNVHPNPEGNTFGY